jgi:hypothetical protein
MKLLVKHKSEIYKFYEDGIKYFFHRWENFGTVENQF